MGLTRRQCLPRGPGPQPRTAGGADPELPSTAVVYTTSTAAGVSRGMPHNVPQVAQIPAGPLSGPTACTAATVRCLKAPLAAEEFHLQGGCLLPSAARGAPGSAWEAPPVWERSYPMQPGGLAPPQKNSAQCADCRVTAPLAKNFQRPLSHLRGGTPQPGRRPFKQAVILYGPPTYKENTPRSCCSQARIQLSTQV